MRKIFHRYKKKYVTIQRDQTKKIRRVHFKNVRRFKKVRKHPFSLPALVLFILIGGFVVFATSTRGKSIIDTSSRIVIISHDGVKESFPTKAPTVGALLQKLTIKISPGDVVEPSISTRITQNDFRVNIYRAKPVEIVDGNRRYFAFSAATTPRSIASQTGVQVYSEDNLNIMPTANFVTEGAIGEQIHIDRATPVNFNVYGASTTVRTRTKTVGQLLKEKNITLAKDDSVQPSVDTVITPNAQVYLIHKGTQIITASQTIPMTVQTIQDNTLAYGTSAIRQQGSDGTEILTYQVNLQNGREVGRSLIQTVVTSQPVTQIVVQGTNLSGIKGDMAIAGIAPQDYQYADYIISHESGWCPTKAQGEHYCPVTPDNSGTSYGYGLCQATPGYKMSSAGADWATNPVTQLEWCNGYASRYGGWYGSYLHWMAYSNW